MLIRGIEFDLGPYKANGFSIGSRVSWLAIPALGVIFDAGWVVDAMRHIPRLFLTHLHLDHSLAFFTWAVWRNDFLDAEGPPQIYLPAASLEATDELVRGWFAAQRTTIAVELIGLEDGDSVELGEDRRVIAFETPHYLTTLGYRIEERRQKLKPSFLGAPKETIMAARQRGEVITDDSAVTLLAYTSDTTPELFDAHPELLDAEVLITECSYVDGVLSHDPGDASHLGERDTSHNHIRPLARALAGFRGDTLAFNHLPVAYVACDMRAYLLPRLPPHLRERLTLIPYHEEPIPERLIPHAPGPRPIPPPREPGAQLDPEAWQTIAAIDDTDHRQPDFDPELRDEFPQAREAWALTDALLDRAAALALYEDAYRLFLVDQPELLDWLVATAADVVRDGPEDAAGVGLGYPQGQESIYLTAIRRALIALGTWFRGDRLLEIRGVRSEGFALNPGVVPFHQPERIRRPLWQRKWCIPGSVLCFWNSCRVLVVPKT